MIIPIWIPGWMPTYLNRLLRSHHMKAHSLKKKDYEIISRAFYAHGSPIAKGKRKIDFQFTLEKKQRKPDADALWKVLKDGLVHCRALINDSPGLCQDGHIGFTRVEEGGVHGTLVILEDLY